MDLSNPWTGFTQFTPLEEKPPDGKMWSGEERLTKRQVTVDYGFCYTVNRSFTVCHPLTLLGLRTLERSFQ